MGKLSKGILFVLWLLIPGSLRTVAEEVFEREEYLSLESVTHGEPGFVAVGSPGLIYFSPDGETWLRVRKTPDEVLRKIAFAKGSYFALGFFEPLEAVTFLRSETGLKWDSISLPGAAGLQHFADGGTTLLAAGGSTIWHSLDGHSWQNLSFTTNIITSLVWTGERFLATTISRRSNRTEGVWHSVDGFGWSQYTLELDLNAELLKVPNGVLLPGGKTYWSAQGLGWNSAPESDAFFHPPSLLAAGGLLLRASIFPYPSVSFQGSAWQPIRDLYCIYPSDLAYGNRKWVVAAGGNSSLLSSQNGVDWQTHLHFCCGRPLITKGPPRFRAELRGIKASAEQPVVLQVDAAGGFPLSYQWFREDLPLDGLTQDYLYFPKLSAGDTGNYRVVVRNSEGAATSNWARVSLLTPQAPRFTSSPQSRTALLGEALQFRATTSGTPPLTYRWFHNEQLLSESAPRSLSIPSFHPTNSGRYHLTVSNALGSAVSEPFELALRKPIFTAEFSPAGRAAHEPTYQPDWRSIVWGAERFVAVGGLSNAIVSPDGLTWMQALIPSSGSPMAVEFDGTEFFAGTTRGEIFRSADGSHWTLDYQAPGPITCFGRSETLLLAGGPGGLIIVRNQAGWSTVSIGSNDQLNDIAWLGDRFLAAAGPALVTSLDGLSWARESLGTNITWQAILPSPNNFYAFGFEHSLNQISTAVAGLTNAGAGIQWIQQTDPFFRGQRHRFLVEDALALHGRVIALGQESATGRIFTRTNQVWAQVPLPGLPPFTAGAANETRAVVVGDEGIIITSADLLNWQSQQKRLPPILQPIYVNGRFIALPERELFVSTNGTDWAHYPTTLDSAVYRLDYKDGVYLAKAMNGIYHSTNLIDWTPRSVTSFFPYEYVLSGNLFVGTIEGQIVTSQKGYQDWVYRRSLPSTLSFRPFAVGDGNHWVAGPGYFYRSADGLTWTLIRPNRQFEPREFCFANGVYLLSAIDLEGQQLLESRDGASWEPIPVPGFGGFSIQSVNGLFYLISGTGELFCSKNGRNWDLSFNSPSASMFLLTIGGNNLLAYLHFPGFNRLELHQAKLVENPQYLFFQPTRSKTSLELHSSGVNEVDLEWAPTLKGPWTSQRRLIMTSPNSELPIPSNDGTGHGFYRARILR